MTKEELKTYLFENLVVELEPDYGMYGQRYIRLSVKLEGEEICSSGISAREICPDSNHDY